MPVETHAASSRRRVPPWLALGLAGLGLLVVGWPLAWYFTSREVGRAVDDWLASEAAAGRAWSCGDRRVGGFPLKITLSCEAPSLAMTAFGGPARAGATRLVATARAYAPYHVIVEVTGPLSLSDATGRRADLGWDALEVHVRGAPGAPERLEIEATAPTWTATDPASGRFDARGRRLELHFRKSARHPPADAAIDVAGRIEDLSSPQIAALAASQDTIGADVTATITATDQPGGDLAAWLDGWRAGNGALEVESLRVASGPARAEAGGTLTLDAEHRPAGRLDVALAGAGPVLRRFGVDPAALTVGSALSGLFGGARAGAPVPVGMDRLALRLDQGRVSLGPFRSAAILRPLY